MPSLPVLAKSKELELRYITQDYLNFSSDQKTSRYNRSALERDALKAISNRKYLYIDFQSENSILQLQRKTSKEYESEDEVQELNHSKIGGMKILKQINLPSYRMHKFLNEEREYLQKRNNWNRILGKQKYRDTLIQFNKIKEKVNPQKLQQYLEHKNIENIWKKIEEREERLYHCYPHTDNTNSYQRSSHSLPSNRKTKPQHRFETRLKLKALKNLSVLLQG